MGRVLQPVANRKDGLGRVLTTEADFQDTGSQEEQARSTHNTTGRHSERVQDVSIHHRQAGHWEWITEQKELDCTENPNNTTVVVADSSDTLETELYTMGCKVRQMLHTRAVFLSGHQSPQASNPNSGNTELNRICKGGWSMKHGSDVTEALPLVSSVSG